MKGKVGRATAVRIIAGIIIIGIIAGIILPSCLKRQERKEKDQPAAVVEEAGADATEEAADAYLQVRFLDVGEADAALLECGGQYMLIDGGRKEDSEKIYTILKEAGISYQDIVVGSHAHEDHVGGLAGALSYAAAGLILCPVTEYDSEAFRDFKKYADQNGGIEVPQAGAVYTLGEAEVQILGLNAGMENDTSMILKITYGETAVLFTGDAEKEAESTVLKSGVDLKADILKTAHHGSDSSTSVEFIEAVKPEYAVISVGAGNEYGHPSAAVLERLHASDASILRTDLQGEIVCRSDGNSFTVVTERQAAPEELLTPGTRDWSVDEKEAPDHYLVNIRSSIFHYPDCEGASEMSEKNEKIFEGSREEAVEEGYIPCAWCRP